MGFKDELDAILNVIGRQKTYFLGNTAYRN